MTNFRSIAAATDFSVDGNNAVRRAAQIARQYGARLTIVHVLEKDAFAQWDEWLSPSLDLSTRLAQARVTAHRLAREVRDADDFFPATVDVQTGEATASLLRVAADVDLLVLGQRASKS